jgi:glycosyltransferase involved in cell wall biosynthesis
MPETVDWEVLVVDNSSQDDTRVVVEDFCNQYPRRFRYLFEPLAGKSFALNSGIRESRGGILVFTDDDVTVDAMWLQALTRNLHHGEWVGASGRTLPERGFLPPRWLSLNERNFATLGCFDRGLETFELTEAPFGNNMAYRREMFEKYGDFHTELGPQPGNLIRCEDSEFGQRLLVAGERLRYEASALLFHSVPDSRIQKEYFLSWWFDKARADVRAFGFEPATKWRVGGVPLILLRRFMVGTLRWTFAVESAQRFSRKIELWYVSGQILECYKQGRSRRGVRGSVSVNGAAISSPTDPKHT